MRGLNRVVMIFPLVLVAATAVADSMRCGSYIVSDGDSQSRVLDLCGEPRRAWQDGFIEQVVRRNDGITIHPRRHNLIHACPATKLKHGGSFRSTSGEYNLGRGTFLKTLVFQGDTLARIIDGPRQ